MASPPNPPRDADPTTGPMGSSTTLVKPTSLHPPGPWPTTPPPPSSTPDGMVPISDMAGPESESGNDAMMKPLSSFRNSFLISSSSGVWILFTKRRTQDTHTDTRISFFPPFPFAIISTLFSPVCVDTSR